MPQQLELEFDDMPAVRRRPRPNRLAGRASVLIQPLRRASLWARARARRAAAGSDAPDDAALDGPDDAYFDAWTHAHYDPRVDAAAGTPDAPSR